MLEPTRMGGALAVAFLLAVPAAAEDRPLPPQLAFVTGVLHLYDESYGTPGYKRLDFQEYEFRTGGKQRGKYWQLRGTMDGKVPAENMATMKAAFLKSGWTVAEEKTAGGALLTLRLSQKGVDSWAEGSFGEEVRVTLVEVGANALVFALKPPGPTPEKLDTEKGEIPYLTAPPGSKLLGGSADGRPFWFRLPNAPQPEMVAPGSILRTYTSPAGFSNLQFITGYKDALGKVGWQILSEHNSADAELTAHYAQHERNIWAYLHQGGGQISLAVADLSGDLAADLAKDCHVALYGVLFDFDKATLQPASDPVLEKVSGLMKKQPALSLQVEGHTDSVGKGDYNQKLSEARAASVVTWLTGHGVAAQRLSSHGFGMTRPVADNKTDEGRARNRRVEISDPKCKAKGK